MRVIGIMEKSWGMMEVMGDHGESRGVVGVTQFHTVWLFQYFFNRRTAFEEGITFPIF